MKVDGRACADSSTRPENRTSIRWRRLAAIRDALDEVNARVDRLEGELASIAGTLPWTDGQEGRSDETTA
jgi:hypothetical protein